MITLQNEDTLYIYASGYIDCEILGYTLIDGITTPKVLFNYHLLAGQTRRSFVSYQKTVIQRISIFKTSVGSATVKVFVNGTTNSEMVYQGDVSGTYKEIMDARGWVDNTAGDNVETIDNNNYFP